MPSPSAPRQWLVAYYSPHIDEGHQTVSLIDEDEVMSRITYMLKDWEPVVVRAGYIEMRQRGPYKDWVYTFTSWG